MGDNNYCRASVERAHIFPLVPRLVAILDLANITFVAAFLVLVNPLAKNLAAAVLLVQLATGGERKLLLFCNASGLTGTSGVSVATK